MKCNFCGGEPTRPCGNKECKDKNCLPNPCHSPAEYAKARREAWERFCAGFINSMLTWGNRSKDLTYPEAFAQGAKFTDICMEEWEARFGETKT
jgi:hypothetical protein